MNFQSITLLGMLMCTTSFAVAQKAFEAVYYTGQTQSLTIHFLLADGYLGGCQLTTTDHHTHKKSLFTPDVAVPDSAKRLRLEHVTKSGRTFTDYFLLNGMEENFDHVPDELRATYYFKGKGHPVTLFRVKENAE